MRKVKADWHGAVFVCCNERDPEEGRASCGEAAGSELRRWLKDRRRAEGLKGEILAARSSCLGVCSPQGITIAILPDPSRGDRELVVFPADGDREALWARVKEVLMGADRRC